MEELEEREIGEKRGVGEAESSGDGGLEEGAGEVGVAAAEREEGGAVRLELTEY